MKKEYDNPNPHTGFRERYEMNRPGNYDNIAATRSLYQAATMCLGSIIFITMGIHSAILHNQEKQEAAQRTIPNECFEEWIQEETEDNFKPIMIQ